MFSQSINSLSDTRMSNFLRKLQPYTRRAGFLTYRSQRRSPSHMLYIQWYPELCSLNTVAGPLGILTQFPLSLLQTSLFMPIWNLYIVIIAQPQGCVNPSKKILFQAGVVRLRCVYYYRRKTRSRRCIYEFYSISGRQYHRLRTLL